MSDSTMVDFDPTANVGVDMNTEGKSSLPDEPEKAAPDNPQEEISTPAAAEATTTATEPPPPDKWAKHFDKLSRKDQELRKKEAELSAHASEVEQARQLAKLAKEDKLQLLQKLGVSVEDVLKGHLNGGKPDPSDEIKALREEVKELRNLATGSESRMEMRDMGSRWDREFNDLMAKDEYAIIRDWPGADQRIIQDVANHYQSTKQLLNPKLVLDTMSQQLRDNLRAMAKHMSQKESPADTAPAEPKAQSKNPGPKTLTKKTDAVARFSPLDDDEAEMARIAAKYS